MCGNAHRPEQASAEESTADETAAEETTDSDAAVGTRENPLPAGDSIEVTTWDGKPEYRIRHPLD